MYTNFFIKNLSDKEMSEINGDGLVEDIGYISHMVYDKACKACNRVKEIVDKIF